MSDGDAPEARPAGRTSYATPAMLALGGGLLGAAAGAHFGAKGREGLQLGTRLKGLGAQWRARRAPGGTRRALLQRAGRLMSTSPRAYHAVRGAAEGVLVGGSAGLGAGLVAQSLKKEGSVAYVIVKKAALTPEQRAARGAKRNALAQKLEGLGDKARDAGEVGKKIRYRGAALGASVRGMQDALHSAFQPRAAAPVAAAAPKKFPWKGLGLAAAGVAAGTGAYLLARKRKKTAAKLVKRKPHINDHVFEDHPMEEHVFEHGVHHDHPFEDKDAGKVRDPLLDRRMGSGLKSASHCPPCSAKKHDKKILIKHHEKDLQEAVRDRDQNYAKRTVKDIEEIEEGKHAFDRWSTVEDINRDAFDPQVIAQDRIVMRQQEKIARERFADELDMVEGVRPVFLREAPKVALARVTLPPLHPKLAYDDGGLKIGIHEDIVESMLKIAAARPPRGGGSGGFLRIPMGPEGVMIFPAPTGASAAAQAAAVTTAEKAHAPTTVETAMKGLRNLGGTFKNVLTGEGGPGYRKAQAGLAIGLAAGAALGIRQLYKRREVQQQYDHVLGQVMNDPHFKNVQDRDDRVPEAYAFLRRYAPTLAMDPVIARSFVRQAIESDVGFMNQTLAQGLSEAESKHLDASRAKKELKDLLSHPFVSPFVGSAGKGSEGK